MTNSLMQVKPVEIDGLVFQIRLLPFGDARIVYSKLQRLMSAFGEEAAEAGLGFFMFAGLAGAINDDDLKLYIDTFGKKTDVALGPNQSVILSDDNNRQLVFAGRFEMMFAWLDACIEYNFKGVMEKLSAAQRHMQAKSAAKAKPKQD